MNLELKKIMVMCLRKSILLFVFVVFCISSIYSQDLAQIENADEINLELNDIHIKYEKLKQEDSIKYALLSFKLNELKDSIAKYKSAENKLLWSDSIKTIAINNRIEVLKEKSIGQPVVLMRDTLFLVFTKRGESSATERAASISAKLTLITNNDFFNVDSLGIVESLNSTDIVYKDIIVMSVSKVDELWMGRTQLELATEYLEIIKTHIIKRIDEKSFSKQLTRLLYVLGISILLVLIILLINRLIKKAKLALITNVDWYNKLHINNYSLISKTYFNRIILTLIGIVKWSLISIAVYFYLIIAFELYPATRFLTNYLLQIIIVPLKKFGLAFLNYLPNLMVILAIYFLFRFIIKGLKFIFDDIKNEKLKIRGFYPDFANPTFNIIRGLFYIFMIVLIYPYLPASDSNIFRGASVFVGVLISIGSSNALSNVIAGLLLTYMRSFKINDRIKIGDLSGDVIEKTLLNIKMRTPKNEEITIPNSTVLSSKTINFTTNSIDKGLILYTTISLGYDVEWKKVYATLIEAANKTNLVLKDPSPYVLQTSLDDFYVSYQLNIYTNRANKKNRILSELHENIQNMCNENGIEILSPHYESLRDGSRVAIPEKYIPENYQAPYFTHRSTNSD
jgi:small-conductance mechanosensitive channel